MFRVHIFCIADSGPSLVFKNCWTIKRKRLMSSEKLRYPINTSASIVITAPSLVGGDYSDRNAM